MNLMICIADSFLLRSWNDSHQDLSHTSPSQSKSSYMYMLTPPPPPLTIPNLRTSA